MTELGFAEDPISLMVKLFDICAKLGWSVQSIAEHDDDPVCGLIVGTDEFRALFGFEEADDDES